MAIIMHQDCSWQHFVLHLSIHSSTTGWVSVQILLIVFSYFQQNVKVMQAVALEMFCYTTCQSA